MPNCGVKVWGGANLRGVSFEGADMRYTDYEEMAKKVKEMTPLSGDVKATALKLIDMFKKDNPRFDEEKFWAAVEGGKKENA